MNCGMECIKYLIFVFNFIFALLGLGILITAVLQMKGFGAQTQEVLDVNVSLPATTLIVVGAIIFIIAFLGCCGAIRESHCMIVTFAVIIMTLLVIQIAVAVYAFSIGNPDKIKKNIDEGLNTSMRTYWEKKVSQDVMNTVQTLAECCGYNNYNDYLTTGNRTIPYSCCKKEEGKTCLTGTDDIFKDGCHERVIDVLKSLMKMFGTLALVVGGVELIGIIFALCLASSIKNAERRGYKV